MRRHRLVQPRYEQPIADDDRADLLLVLAIDLSYSVSPAEGRMQVEGYAAALRDPRVLGAIASGVSGAIGLAAVGWAGLGFQKLLVPWRRIAEERHAHTFAVALGVAWAPAQEHAALEAFPNGAATCLSCGINHAAVVLRDAPWESPRRVIDVSGDGPNNEGPPAEEARDRAVAEGITINGLAIEGDPDVAFVLGPGATLTEYYRDAVIGGSGAFVVTAENIRAFGDAIRRKLIREIVGHAPPPGNPA